MKSEDHVVTSKQLSTTLLLMLHTLRSVVEKHGGAIEIDEKDNSLFLNIPESNKVACFKELEESIKSR